MHTSKKNSKRTSKQIFALLTCGTLLLLCVPLIALAIGWQWQPVQEIPVYLYSLYLVTETGTVPYAFISCAVLAGIPLLYLKPSLKKGIVLVFIMVVSIGVGQAVKSTLKNIYQETRPYVLWLDQTGYIPQQAFYDMPRPERTDFIAKQDFSQHNIPMWQQQHWSKETGYSFPSGHSIFAAQWFLIYLLLLWHKKAYLPIGAVAIWALGIETSRLLLAMHWPSDILVSCLLASVLIYPTYLCWSKWGNG